MFRFAAAHGSSLLLPRQAAHVAGHAEVEGGWEGMPQWHGELHRGRQQWEGRQAGREAAGFEKRRMVFTKSRHFLACYKRQAFTARL